MRKPEVALLLGVTAFICLGTSAAPGDCTGGTTCGQSRIDPWEPGFDSQPYYEATLHGGIAITGGSTRINRPPFSPNPTSDPFIVALSGIPSGSTIHRAWVNWSYLTDNKDAPEFAVITVNGSQVTADAMFYSSPSLHWFAPTHPLDNMDYTVTFLSDITALVAQGGGNGNYSIGGALDKTDPDPLHYALGEGVSILVIFEHPDSPLQSIHVYAGLSTTMSAALCAAHGTLDFSEPYPGGEATLFLNALDGQMTTETTQYADWFLLNGTIADGFPGTIDSPNPYDYDAWQGLIGPDTVWNMYDHAYGDPSGFMVSGDSSLTFETSYIPGLGVPPEAIAHALAAVAFSSCDTLAEPCGEFDCNGNAVQDVCDVYYGTSNDADENGVPDECECPEPILFSADPPDGAIDARKPYPAGATSPVYGFGMPDDPGTVGKDESTYYPIVIDIGVTGADPACFALCETPEPSAPDMNAIAGVTDHGDGTYTIALAHGARAGHVTTIDYLGSTDYVEYIHHPANVDGSGSANTNDIIVVVDCLNYPGTCENYEADVDASGQQTSNDIVMVIDLLNGADAYDPWYNTDLPANNGACPVLCEDWDGQGGQGLLAAPEAEEEESDFGPWFAGYLLSANPTNEPALAECIITVEVLTRWCAGNLTPIEKREVIALLTDPETKFANATVEALVPRIVGALE